MAKSFVINFVFLAVGLLSTDFSFNGDSKGNSYGNAYASDDTTTVATFVATVPLKSALSNPPPMVSMLEKRHQHVVLQQWELSCAAAALATILRYQHGLPVTERLVALGMVKRKEYLANPDLLRIRQGFSLLDLKRYVDKLGFEGRGLGQLSFDDLLDHAPIIVPVVTRGYPHFVVFRGATDNKVLIADPAFGNVTMPIYKFMDGWIKYKDINHVGFIVTNAGNLAAPGKLAARASDFVNLN